MGNAKSLQTVSPSKSSTSFVAPVSEQISPSKTPGIMVPSIVLPIGDEHSIKNESQPVTPDDEENVPTTQQEYFAPGYAEENYDKKMVAGEGADIKAGKTIKRLKFW